MRIFKFIGLGTDFGNSNVLRVIQRNELRTTSYRNLNDPFEFQFSTKRPDQEKLFRFVTAQKNSKKGAISFSSSKDDLLMWAHYANSHRGVCFEFETEDDPILRTARKMVYQPKIPIFKKENPDGILFAKSLAWKYENEVRVLTPGRVDQFIAFEPRALRTVYFGLKAETLDIDSLDPVCRARGIAIYSADTVQDDYRLQFRNVSTREDYTVVARSLAIQKRARDFVKKLRM